MPQKLDGKRILVTGACGTVGIELINQLLEKYNVEEVIGIDNNESALFFTEQRFSKHKNARFFLADIRDKYEISRKLKHVHIVFHSAAFKHVVLCEKSPFEAVQTNILGVNNIIDAAFDNDVQKVIFTSSDKAVNPTNVMGTSKLMGERLMTAANSNQRSQKTIFASTRFGNVLGSRGSVIPIFREQIKKGGPVTLTDSEMTRFIMSIDKAVQLVIDSSLIAHGGEVFVTKMPVIKIIDLAKVMINELAPKYGYAPSEIEIVNIGPKPGEKMYEELMSLEETQRSVELIDYYAISPAFKCIYHDISYKFDQVISQTISKPYNSSNVPCMKRDELADFLRNNNLLFEDPQSNWEPDERYWPCNLDENSYK